MDDVVRSSTADDHAEMLRPHSSSPSIRSAVALCDRVAVPVLALLLLVAIPAFTDAFRLAMFGKYLSFAFCAVGLVLAWGYGGILSLGQGIFFGLGSYLIAMAMKLEATSADPAAAVFNSEGPPVPDFMTWNSVDVLPWWWMPFEHLWFAVAAVIVLPAGIAFALGYANFRKRVSGVYFSIVTICLAAMASIVIIGQQGYTGGINGITNLSTFGGYDIRTDIAVYAIYFVTALFLLSSILLGKFILRSRLGRVLIAVRDREDRIRFSGYDPAMFKAVIFAVAALLSAVGGALFTLQVGFASPSVSGIVPSIEMVIYSAVGGRLSLVGAVYGTLIICLAKSLLSEQFPSLWMYFMGVVFILTTMVFPKGLSGALDRFRGTKEER
jgi:urea transport system permease protein